jgi:hypothetical protein
MGTKMGWGAKNASFQADPYEQGRFGWHHVFLREEAVFRGNA